MWEKINLAKYISVMGKYVESMVVGSLTREYPEHPPLSLGGLQRPPGLGLLHGHEIKNEFKTQTVDLTKTYRWVIQVKKQEYIPGAPPPPAPSSPPPPPPWPPRCRCPPCWPRALLLSRPRMLWTACPGTGRERGLRRGGGGGGTSKGPQGRGGRGAARNENIFKTNFLKRQNVPDICNPCMIFGENAAKNKK